MNPRDSGDWFSLANALDMKELVATWSNNARVVYPNKDIIPSPTEFDALASCGVNANTLPSVRGCCIDDWVAACLDTGIERLELLAGLPEEATPADGLHTPENPKFLCSTGQFLFMCPIPSQAYQPLSWAQSPKWFLLHLWHKGAPVVLGETIVCMHTLKVSPCSGPYSSSSTYVSWC